MRTMRVSVPSLHRESTDSLTRIAQSNRAVVFSICTPVLIALSYVLEHTLDQSDSKPAPCRVGNKAHQKFGSGHQKMFW